MVIHKEAMEETPLVKTSLWKDVSQKFIINNLVEFLKEEMKSEHVHFVEPKYYYAATISSVKENLAKMSCTTEKLLLQIK